MIEIIHGDAFDVLPQMEPRSFAAIVTDPPYSSGGKAMARKQGIANAAKYFDACGMEFDDGTRDQMAHRLWTQDWLRLCHRLLEDGGWLMVFTDWRQLPLTCVAVQCAGFVWQGVNVWHKPNGLPQLGRFFRADEFIVVASKGQPPGGPSLRGTGAKTVAQVWEGMLSPKERYHATSKPVGLMAHLLQVVRKGGRVLDPFAGGGSTLVAAELSGLDSVGVEITADNAERARQRIAALLTSQEAGGGSSMQNKRVAPHKGHS